MAAAGANIVEVERFGTDPAVDRRVFEVLTAERDSRSYTALLVSNYLMWPQGMVGVETFSYCLAADGGLDRIDRLQPLGQKSGPFYMFLICVGR